MVSAAAILTTILQARVRDTDKLAADFNMTADQMRRRLELLVWEGLVERVTTLERPGGPFVWRVTAQGRAYLRVWPA